MEFGIWILIFFSSLGKNKEKTRKASWSVRIKEAQGISQSDRENHVLKRPKTYVSEKDRVLCIHTGTQHLRNSLGESHRNLDDTIQWKGKKSETQVRQLRNTEKNIQYCFQKQRRNRGRDSGENTDRSIRGSLVYLATPLQQTTIIALFNLVPLLLTMFLLNFAYNKIVNILRPEKKSVK